MSKLLNQYRLIASGSDPNFANVVALLHFDGTNGSTTFTDVKGNTWTRSGTAVISTSQQKFGGASLSDPTQASYLLTGSHSKFGYGTGDFTIEMWIRASSVSSTRVFYDQREVAGGGGGTRPSIYLNAGVLSYFADGSDRITGATLSANVWYYVAVSRVSGTTRMFLNGNLQGAPWTDATNYDASPVMIGEAANNPGGTEGFQGFIDELRITKGVGRYTSNFTQPTAAFPNF